MPSRLIDFSSHRRQRSGFQWRNGPAEEIRPGDAVWIAPGEKHRHGAAATTEMTQIAIQEQIDGTRVDWLERSATGNTKPGDLTLN
jgi:hypothetical protein